MTCKVLVLQGAGVVAEFHEPGCKHPQPAIEAKEVPHG